jgi:cell division protein FtsA
LHHAVDRTGIHINNYVVAGLAAAESVLDRKQKESGTAVIDIGAGTTSIAILEEGEIEHVAVIPAGGMHITNDLAIGLRTTLDIAEKVKLAFSGLDDISLGECSVEQNGEKIIFDKSMVKMIIESRVEEILEMVDKEFVKVKKSKKLPGGVVFVGGTAQLRGLAEFAKDKLALPASVGKVRNVTGLLDKVKSVKMATLIGIMMLDAALPGVHSQHNNEKSWMPNLKFFEKFKK